MRLKFTLAIFSLFLLAETMVFSPIVYAGSANNLLAQDTPQYINPFTDKPKCGVADPKDPNSTSALCCTDTQALQKSQDDIKDLRGFIPDFGLLDGVLNIAFKFMGVTDVISRKCYIGNENNTTGTCKCTIAPLPSAYPELEKLCGTYIKTDEKNTCIECATKYKGYYSGMGCIPLNFSTFISDYVLRIGIGLAGVAAMFCIIYSAIMIQSSRGNAERIKKAQEQLTSCVIGLILIIFSIFILRLIGVDILHIPGFT